MNTKIIMTLSALVLGAVGLTLSFLPEEIIEFFNIESTMTIILIFQLLGSLYLGFGILNWMAKGSLIGGIYNKPIVIANLMHFGIGAITFFKIDVGNEMTLLPAGVYVLFASALAYVFMNHPKLNNRPK